MSQLQQLPATQKSEIEFVPYGAQDPIKLSVNIIKNYVAIPTKSGKLPDDRECIRFLMLCKSRRLNPFEGDCFLQGYDGRDGAQFSLITAHQAFLKRAEHHPEYDGMRSGVIVRTEASEVADREGDFTFDEDTLLGAWATIYFKQRKQPMHRRLKLATFRKPFGRWNDDAAGMIVKCAEADALRSSFPTLLGGLYSAEEIGRIEPTNSTVRLADLSDLGPQKPSSSPAAQPGNVVPMSAPTDGKAASGPATAAGPATGESPAVCKYCQQPVPDMNSHSCEGMQAALAATKEQPEAPPQDRHKAAMAKLGELMQADGITPEVMLSFTLANKLRKPAMKIGDMADSKIENLASSWATILPELVKLKPA